TWINEPPSSAARRVPTDRERVQSNDRGASARGRYAAEPTESGNHQDRRPKLGRGRFGHHGSASCLARGPEQPDAGRPSVSDLPTKAGPAPADIGAWIPN